MLSPSLSLLLPLSPRSCCRKRSPCSMPSRNKAPIRPVAASRSSAPPTGFAHVPSQTHASRVGRSVRGAGGQSAVNETTVCPLSLKPHDVHRWPLYQTQVDNKEWLCGRSSFFMIILPGLCYNAYFRSSPTCETPP